MIRYGQSNAVRISGRTSALVVVDMADDDIGILFEFQPDDARKSAKFYKTFGFWRIKWKPFP